ASASIADLVSKHFLLVQIVFGMNYHHMEIESLIVSYVVLASLEVIAYNVMRKYVEKDRILVIIKRIPLMGSLVGHATSQEH
ncbi:MAG: hypothetical protein ABW185_24850, partial [Sedimenticola sp.]